MRRRAVGRVQRRRQRRKRTFPITLPGWIRYVPTDGREAAIPRYVPLEVADGRWRGCVGAWMEGSCSKPPSPVSSKKDTPVDPQGMFLAKASVQPRLAFQYRFPAIRHGQGLQYYYDGGQTWRAQRKMEAAREREREREVLQLGEEKKRCLATCFTTRLSHCFLRYQTYSVPVNPLAQPAKIQCRGE